MPRYIVLISTFHQYLSHYVTLSYVTISINRDHTIRYGLWDGYIRYRI